MVFTAKKKSKTGLQILPKNNPHLSQKTEKKGGHCTSPLIKKMSSYIYSSYENPLRSPAWKNLLSSHRIPWRNETHSDLLSNSHGRVFILCTNQIGLSNSAESILYRQVRHSWVHTGKFAILEFIPASSPFLSSHLQVRHSWVHTGKIAIFVFIAARFAKFWVYIGKIRQVLSSYRQDSPSFEFLSARFAKFLCSAGGQKIYTASVPIPVYSEWIRPECQRVFERPNMSPTNSSRPVGARQ